MAQSMMTKFKTAMKKNFEQYLKERVIQNEINSKLQKEQEAEARGDAIISDQQVNFLLLWGCPPATGVKSDTTMVDDIGKVFLEKINVSTLSLIIPQALEEVTGKDASFEIA